MNHVVYFNVALFFHVTYSDEVLIINSEHNVHHSRSTQLFMLSLHKPANRITPLRYNFVIISIEPLIL